MNYYFERAVAITLREECGPDPDATGLVDDPTDPGGLTKYGISQKAHPGLDIRGLSRAQAIEIYRSEYWTAAQGDELPWPLCAFVFDHAVTSGAGMAILLLQISTQRTRPDGKWGPLTREAVRRFVTSQRPGEGLKELCRSYNVNRNHSYLAIDAGSVRWGAWTGRVAAVALATGWLSDASV